MGDGRRAIKGEKEEVTYLDYVSLHCHSLQVCCRRGEGHYVNDIEGVMKEEYNEGKKDPAVWSNICILKEEDRIKIITACLTCLATFKP